MRKKYRKVIKDECNEAIVFARVSSEKQEKGASIDAQKDVINDYCQNKGLKIIKEFTITESTMLGDRVQYHEMLNFIQKRDKKAAIVVNCVDRLQRSDKDNPVLDDLRRTGKIEVHFIKENMVLTKDSLGTDLLFWKMHVLMANSYVISLSSNVKRSLEYNWSQGKWQGFAPIGYLNKTNEDETKTLIVDSVRAPIVKHLFETFARGNQTLRSIWNLSKELGLYSKVKSKGNNSLVSKNTVYDILTNPFYYGEMCIKGDFMPHIYQPLVTKELYDKVQQLFINNGNRNRNNTEEFAKTPYIFRGLIHCKECGCLITPETKTKPNGTKYVYLRCGHPCKECGQGIVNEKVIIEQLTNEVFKKITLSTSMQEALKEKLLKDLNDTSRFNATIKRSITNKLNELKAKEDKLLDFYLEGKLPQTTYDVKITQINTERQELETNAEKYKVIDADIKENINKIMSMIGNISYVFEKASVSRKNELLRLLVSDCKLTGSKLEYTLNKPFDKLVACQDYKQWPMIAINNLEEFDGLRM